MEDYIDVRIDIFEHTGQKARVRRSLSISGLIEEILKEFDDISRDTIDKYAMYLKGTERPLSKSSTMTDLDLQPQDELVFEYKHQNMRENLLPDQYAVLEDENTKTRFDIQWQPAVVGRPTAEAEHNMMLAVNVQSIPNSMTISRRHAQITFSDDHYYVEPLTENNPLLVNGEEVPFNSRKEIHNQDVLTFGKHNVKMVFLTQPGAKPVNEEKNSQPEPALSTQPYKEKPKSKPMPPPPIPTQPPAIQGYAVMENPISSSLPASQMVIEEASEPGSIGQQIDIGAYPFILGRILPILSTEKGVSRQHAEVNFDPQTKVFTIIDLQSTNGVTIGGQTILSSNAYEIKGETHIGLGPNVILKFVVNQS